MISYFEKQLKEIDRAIHSLDDATFREWVSQGVATIESGHKIIASGLGKNVPICEKFVGTMISMGMDAFFLHTNSAIHGDMGIVKEGDMVILLTKSGETEESVYLTRLLKPRNIHLWLLTFEENSTLTKEIKNSVVLSMDHEGDLWNIMPNNSTTINLIVLQGFAMQIAAARGIRLEDFRRNHPGGNIGHLLEKSDSE